jgi:hypothetical protein
MITHLIDSKRRYFFFSHCEEHYDAQRSKRTKQARIRYTGFRISFAVMNRFAKDYLSAIVNLRDLHSLVAAKRLARDRLCADGFALPSSQ